MTGSQTKLKPGVVAGEDYKTLVNACKAGGYALSAVNQTSSATINATLEAAAKNEADIIIQVSSGGAGNSPTSWPMSLASASSSCQLPSARFLNPSRGDIVTFRSAYR